jgi:hypothetical protein
MPKTPFVLAAMAGIGLAGGAEFAATDIRTDGKMVGDLGYSLAAGVILGSAVWPYGLNPTPPDLQSTLVFNPPGCDGDGQCGMYGLASAAFVNTGAEVVMVPSPSSDSPSIDRLDRRGPR